MDITTLLMREIESAVGFPCYPTVPAERPDAFVTVQCTGGSEGVVLSYPNVAVQSWAATQQEAHELAVSVGQAMRALPYGNSGVTHVDAGIPYHFPSTEKIPRYQALYSLTVHN